MDENKDLKEVQNEEILDEKKEEETVEEVTQDELKGMISDSVSKKFDEFSEKIINKFKDNLDKQRKGVLEVGKETEKQRLDTKSFINALVSGDTQKLNSNEKIITTGSSATPYGGYTIPTELLTEVIRIANEYGVARREMRYLPFTGPGNSRDIPKVSTGVTAYWTDEGAAKTSAQPVFAKVTQTLKKLAVIVPLTEEMLEDTGINLTQLVAELVAEAIAYQEDYEFLRGDGTNWTGILNNGSVESVTMTGTTFASVDADDLLDMIDAVPETVRRNGKFFMHNSIKSTLRKLKDKNDQYILQGPIAGDTATLWGKPIVTTDVLPSTTDTAEDTEFMFFGDLKRCAIFGDKQQIRVMMLKEATITDTDGETTVNLAEQDAVAFRFVERVGYVLTLPEGICVLKTGTSGS